jgi:O-antigen biosynthesis protein
VTISLPHAGHPAVSVVMVTYGGWDLTRRTLESVATHTETPAEVVIVDNPAGEDVAGRLRDEVHGAEVVLNDRNVGFGPAANLGVERARGTYVAFLNTDALVRPGWVETLVAALEADPLAGAAVPRFLNEDGTVQEAGGLLFRDGSTLMHGFGADPSDVAYRFRRYADYGSAACLLVRRSDFDAVGGFDPGYVPAYCEDVDLQLKLRERGLRTVFEPRSEVVHVRFGSTGLGEETAARLVEKNTAVLRRRWPHVLAHRPPPFDAPGHEARVLAARDADALERLLVVAEDALPERLLEAVRDRHPTGRVTLLGVRWRPAEGDLDRLLAAGVEVAPFEDPPAWLRARRFHHTAVLAPEGHPPPPIARALMVWQPQAPIITMGAGGAADVVTDLLDELTNVGIPPESALREGHPSAIG